MVPVDSYRGTQWQPTLTTCANCSSEPLYYYSRNRGVPEVLLLCALPFKSQKYLLVSVSVVSGLCVLIPLLLWERSRHRRPRPWLRIATFDTLLVLPITLLAAGSCTSSGTVRAMDGLRAIGGQLFLRLDQCPSSATVRLLFAYLDRNRHFTGTILQSECGPPVAIGSRSTADAVTAAPASPSASEWTRHRCAAAARA